MAQTPERVAAERAVIARRLQRQVGDLVTRSTERMDKTLTWFAALPAKERASVSTIAHSGVTNFVDWFLSDQSSSGAATLVFSSAPRDLTRNISLQQTVELVRTTIEVVEESVDTIAGDNASRQAHLREALLRYSREVAFAAADVYARAAESRGAWDARLQDLVLDSIVNNDDAAIITSRATAAGWTFHTHLFAMVGPASDSQEATEVYLEQIRRTARTHNVDVIVGVQSDLIVVIVGTDTDIEQTAKHFTPHFGRGSVVIGSNVSSFAEAHASLSSALSGVKALPLVSEPDRVVAADQLLAARVLVGDDTARTHLIDLVRNQLGADVRGTLSVFLEHTQSIEATAREQFVHVNTVRYRLKKVADVTGLDPSDPSDALVLRMGLMLERSTSGAN